MGPEDACEVHVDAGQIYTLEVTGHGESISRSQGACEFHLKDQQGNPIIKNPIYLVNESQTLLLEVVINSNGQGKIDNIPFGTYTIHLKKPTIDPAPQTSILSPLTEKLDQRIYFNRGEHVLPTRPQEKRTKAAATLSEKAVATLSEIIDFFQHPLQESVKEICCYGYADETKYKTQSREKNKDLCIKRAKTVKDKLDEKLGGLWKKRRIVNPVKIDSGGVIEGKDYEKNRRVEITITRIYDSLVELNSRSSNKLGWKVVPPKRWEGHFREGHFYAPDDPYLLEYVKSFQLAHGLNEKNGVIGVETIEALWRSMRTRGVESSDAEVKLSDELTEMFELLTPGVHEKNVTESILNELSIFRRNEWGERQPRYERIRNDWNYHTIVIHHVGSENSPEPTYVEEEHMDTRGWDDVGYHYLVARDGTIYEGRKLTKRGGHSRLYNIHRIGICALGDFEDERSLLSNVEEITDEMMGSIINVVGAITKRIPGVTKLCGHRDLPNHPDPQENTVCPGNTLYARLGELRSATNLSLIRPDDYFNRL